MAHLPAPERPPAMRGKALRAGSDGGQAEDPSEKNRKEVTQKIYRDFPHLDFAPIVLVSGKTGLRVHTIFPILLDIWKARQIEIPVKALEFFLDKTTKKHKPGKGKGTRHPKLLGMRQIGVCPPVFEIFVKYRTSVHRSYINFIEKQLREQYNFFGTPIVIKLSKMKK